jgi:hypothetical protein
MVSGLARCSFALRPAGSLTRDRAFCTKGFDHFIASMFASAATGWSGSCRVGFWLSHWSSVPFHGALKHALGLMLANPEKAALAEQAVHRHHPRVYSGNNTTSSSLLPGRHAVIVANEIDIGAGSWPGPLAHHGYAGSGLLSGCNHFWILPFMRFNMSVRK